MPKFDPPQLTQNRNEGNSTYKEWLLETKETEDYVMEICKWERTYTNGETYGGIRKHKNQKFLAVNGPLAGHKIADGDATKQGYIPFNCAVNSRWSKGWPRTIYVHSIGRAENSLFKVVDS